MNQAGGNTPIEGLSETEDKLLQMVVALTAQLSATRERLDTVEALLTRDGALAPDAVDDFSATPDDDTRRSALRHSLIAKVMNPIPLGLAQQTQLLREEND